MDSVFLHGSEDVAKAGSAMREAARDMQQAASNLSGILEQHQRFMDDWLDRFAATMDGAKEETECPTSK